MYIVIRWANWDIQNGYARTVQKGRPDCGGELEDEGGHEDVHGAKEEEVKEVVEHRRRKRSPNSDSGCKRSDGGPVRWFGKMK